MMIFRSIVSEHEWTVECNCSYIFDILLNEIYNKHDDI